MYMVCLMPVWRITKCTWLRISGDQNILFVQLEFISNVDQVFGLESKVIYNPIQLSLLRVSITRHCSRTRLPPINVEKKNPNDVGIGRLSGPQS